MKNFRNMTKAELIEFAQISMHIIMDCEALITEIIETLTTFDGTGCFLISRKGAYMTLSSEDIELINVVMENYNKSKPRCSHES